MPHWLLFSANCTCCRDFRSIFICTNFKFLRFFCCVIKADYFCFCVALASRVIYDLTCAVVDKGPAWYLVLFSVAIVLENRFGKSGSCILVADMRGLNRVLLLVDPVPVYSGKKYMIFNFLGACWSRSKSVVRVSLEKS